MPTRPPVVITGASSGIGAAYADRFARRGHDLVLVARNTERMESLASRLRRETGVAIDNIQADLTQAAELAVVEARLRADTRIGILVNNAGTALGGRFIEQTADDVARLVALNTRPCSGSPALSRGSASNWARRVSTSRRFFPPPREPKSGSAPVPTSTP